MNSLTRIDNIYSDTTDLTKSLLILFKSIIVLTVISVIAILFEMSQSRQFGILVARMFVFAITFIILLIWTFFSNSNLRALGAKGLRFTPGWSVGWFLFPFCNLYKPFQVIKEIWKASKKPENWESVNIPLFIQLWWALWLISFIIKYSSLNFPQVNSDLLFLFSATVDVFLALATMKIVSQVFEMQKRHGVIIQEVEWLSLDNIRGNIYAEMVKEVLDNNNIPCKIKKPFMVSAFGIKGAGIPGTKCTIFVPSDYYEEAAEIQSQMMD